MNSKNKPNSDDTLLVALTLDTDNDFYDSSIGSPDDPFQWRGVREGIPNILDCVERFDVPIPITWFVRVDGQLGVLYGSEGHLLKVHDAIWSRCSDRGDEIAWHAHLYRRVGKVWVQETDDSRLSEDLKCSYQVMRQCGHEPHSSRIGEAYGSNGVMATLNELGIRCDSTAMPGRVRKDEERNLDWGETGAAPYHPSRSDYRKSGEPSLHILEIPMTMVETRTDYDKAPLRRYVDLTYHHEVMRKGLRTCVRENRLVVSVSHPCGVLPGISDRPHGLLSFEIENFRTNLEFLISECRLAGRQLKFIRIKDCWPLFSRSANANE